MQNSCYLEEEVKTNKTKQTNLEGDKPIYFIGGPSLVHISWDCKDPRIRSGQGSWTSGGSERQNECPWNKRWVCRRWCPFCMRHSAPPPTLNHHQHLWSSYNLVFCREYIQHIIPTLSLRVALSLFQHSIDTSTPFLSRFKGSLV